MKRHMGIVTLIAVLALLVASGCGGKEAQAKQYMKNGDPELAKAISSYDRAQTQMSTLATEYAEGKNTEPAGVREKTGEITSLMSKAENSSAEAKKEYKKILELKGAYTYGRYALMQLEVVYTLEELNSTLSKMLGIIDASVSTGQTPDVDSLNRYVEYLRVLSVYLDESQERAAQLRKEKDL